jgi:hypothetical protein
MLKWAGMMGPQQQGLAEQLRAAVAVAAANMLLAAGRSQVPSGSAALLTAEGKPVSEGGSASSSAGGGATTAGSSHPQGGRAEQPAQHSITDSTAQQPAQHGSAHQSTAAAVLPHLPWLGVLGCCCLQWNQQLASLQSSSAAAAVSAARAAAGSADAVVPAAAAAAAAAAASAPAALPHTGVPTRASGVLQVLSQDNIHSWGVAVAPIWQGQSLVMICVETARSWLGGLNSRLQGVGEEGIQPTGAGYVEPVRSAIAAADGFVSAWQALQDSV